MADFNDALKVIFGSESEKHAADLSPRSTEETVIEAWTGALDSAAKNKHQDGNLSAEQLQLVRDAISGLMVAMFLDDARKAAFATWGLFGLSCEYGLTVPSLDDMRELFIKAYRQQQRDAGKGNQLVSHEEAKRRVDEKRTARPDLSMTEIFKKVAEELNLKNGRGSWTSVKRSYQNPE